MTNACTLLQKYKPRFELPKNWVPRLPKAQYRNWHYGSEKLWDLHTCLPKNRTGDILDWKTNQPQNRSTIIYDNFVVVVFSHIFVCSKFRHTKYTQIIWVNGSDCPKRARVHNHYAEELSLNWMKHLTVSCTESDSGEISGWVQSTGRNAHLFVFQTIQHLFVSWTLALMPFDLCLDCIHICFCCPKSVHC